MSSQKPAAIEKKTTRKSFSLTVASLFCKNNAKKSEKISFWIRLKNILQTISKYFLNRKTGLLITFWKKCPWNLSNLIELGSLLWQIWRWIYTTKTNSVNLFQNKSLPKVNLSRTMVKTSRSLKMPKLQKLQLLFISLSQKTQVVVNMKRQNVLTDNTIKFFLHTVHYIISYVTKTK